MLVSMLEQVLIAAFAGLVLWAAVSDARSFIIPNRIAAAVAVLWLAFIILRLAAGLSPDDAVFALALGVGAFTAGFVFFVFRLFGGGDVKLFAAVTLWAGPNLVGSFLAVTLLCGGILATAFLAIRTLRAMTAATVPGSQPANFGGALAGALKSEVPFGLAIAAGGLFVAARLFFENFPA